MCLCEWLFRLHIFLRSAEGSAHPGLSPGSAAPNRCRWSREHLPSASDLNRPSSLRLSLDPATPRLLSQEEFRKQGVRNKVTLPSNSVELHLSSFT
ncbi:hypothetical protein AV530_019342 [Patagioenas fasciata monilis]|uniref:Uncharacterized protein n=1 Tax=Patagioenas fasciata monilis TaxID=372326 RepID=A0A1V4JCZ1_PATFA|nr:hypothetical protein AV530_019342 [Patagioenas fasciata monilis]